MNHQNQTSLSLRERLRAVLNDRLGRTFDLVFLSAVLIILGTAVVAVSQAPYGHGDEGFHLLASQLINLGKRPYLDFFYQHTPVYIYFNALWMRFFGDTWRSAHACSSLLTVACAGMIGGYLYTRFQERTWRLAGAGIAMFMFLGSVLVTQFALIGQPYAVSLVLEFAGFLLTVKTVGRSNFSAIWAGLCSGASVAASLLTLPIAPILFVWMAVSVTKADRLRRGLQFAIGTVVGLLPVWWFAVKAPRQMLFDIVGYHLTSRGKAPLWPGQDFITTATAWLTSTQGLLLVFLSLIGTAFACARRKQGANQFWSEMRLCGLIVPLLTASLGVIRPTFRQYFVLVIPFLTILATSGLYAIGSRISSDWDSFWLIAAVLGMFSFDGAKSVRRQVLGPNQSWSECEQVARLLNQILPQECPIYTNDANVYVAARRAPPSGLENNYSFYLDPRPELKALLHIIPQHEIDNLVANGRFGSVIAVSPTQAERLQLKDLYKNHNDYSGHFVFWSWADPSHNPCDDSPEN